MFKRWYRSHSTQSKLRAKRLIRLELKRWKGGRLVALSPITEDTRTCRVGCACTVEADSVDRFLR